jgi:AAA domain
MMPDSRDLLYSLARSLNLHVKAGVSWDAPPAAHANGQERPGDDFNQRAPWADILQPHGWILEFERAGVGYWRRPGKSEQGHSATTGFCNTNGKDLLYVFSTNCAPFESERTYSKFAAFTLLNYGGDYKAAAKAVADAGYGTQSLPAGKILFGTSGAPGEDSAKPKQDSCPAPIPATALKRSPGSDWIWHGFLSRGSITLMTALWKAGKTTLLAHLLKRMEDGGEFCGLPIVSGRVLYVTEESENKWAERRDGLCLRDNVEFLIRPFRSKPDWSRWNDFMIYLQHIQKDRKADVIVIDPALHTNGGLHINAGGCT